MAYQHTCECGRTYYDVSETPTTCNGCTAKSRCVRRRDDRRRANTVGERYNLLDIAQRDNHRCHICGKPVDMSLSGRHPQGPTADHLLPVAAGGGDDPWNIALAHRRCNIKRGTGGVVQLRLAS